MPQQPRQLNPDASPLARFGARLRAYRTARGWAQSELGQAVHVSGTLIAKMERAERRPQPDVARRLDAALRADGELMRLADDALRFDLAERRIESKSRSGSKGIGAEWNVGINALHRLADLYDVPDDGGIRALSELEGAVTELVRRRLNSDYLWLVHTLPQLIPELSRALLNCRGNQREQVAGLLVQAWRAADAVAAKLGLFELSARLIHVMGWAASQSGDTLAMAATSYVRAETFFVSREPRAGRLMLERAADRVSPQLSAPASAQYGALHMRAAIAAARAGLHDRAGDHLAEARSMARRIDEGIWGGTAFGPASVRIHEVSTAVEMNAPQLALDAAGDWVPPITLPAERRSHYFVDLARAQLAMGRHEAVLSALESAHEIAPQNVRVDPDVRTTLAALAGTSAADAADGFARVVAQARPTAVPVARLGLDTRPGTGPGAPAGPGGPGSPGTGH
jgi:transcriptional regulator with XRE-family HTH domain